MKEEKIKKTDLRIALIKEEKTSGENISFREKCQAILNDENLVLKEFSPSKYIFFRDTVDLIPTWVDKFFNNLESLRNLRSASAKVVLFVEVKVSKDKKRIFAIFFGYGKNLIKKECLEENFGLKVVLNCSDKSEIRSIKKTELTNNDKKCKEQMPSRSTINDFGFNFEGDLIEAITCTVNDKSYIKGTISGGDILALRAAVKIDNIEDFLVKTYMKYISNEYKKQFEWFDNIKCIKNRELIDDLEHKLIDMLNSKNEKVKMAVPECIDWERVDHFEYGRYKDEDDIYIEKVLNTYKDEIDSVSKLKNKKIEAYASESGELIYRWSVYKCIVGEIDNDKNVMYFTNGKWYRINNDFVKKINNKYAESSKANIDFDTYTKDKDILRSGEKEYNIKFVNKHSSSYVNMDRHLVVDNFRYGKIEVCDILGKDKLIHVKIYHGSAGLSHLFMQGKNAAELLLDKEFLDKTNEVLENELKNKGMLDKFEEYKIINPNDYEVVFAIIIKNNRDDNLPNIPFFSKLTFCDARSRLEKLKYKVSIKAINWN